MKTSECNGGFQPAGWKSRDGKLWFPTPQGVVQIDPEHLPVNTHPPNVIIEKILVNNKIVPPMNKLMLNPGKKSVEFHYTAPGFLAPKRMRFKYTLEGFNEEWLDERFPHDV